MKVLSGSAPYLSEWKQERYTSLGCCDLFSAAFSICLGDKRVTRFLRAQRGLRWRSWLLTLATRRHRRAGSEISIWNSHILPSATICKCIQPQTQPSYTSVSAAPASSTVRQVAIGQNEEGARLAHGTWIKDLVAGQHVTAVCALLSTCSSVRLGSRDSRTRIHCMSEHSHSHIPVERDTPHWAICYTALLLTFVPAVPLFI